MDSFSYETSVHVKCYIVLWSVCTSSSTANSILPENINHSPQRNGINIQFKHFLFKLFKFFFWHIKIGSIIYMCVLSVHVLVVCMGIHSAERYSGLPDEGVILNAIGVTIVAIVAVVMYIVSRNKFKTEPRNMRASVDL